MNELASHNIPCLGRPFHLGMLYNSCTEQLVHTGRQLWDIKELENPVHAITEDSNDVNQGVILEGTIEEKSLHLEMNAELKLSFLSGLVKAGTSASYTYDRKTSKEQTRATFKYSCSTGYKIIDDCKPHLRKDAYEAERKESFFGATHVVVGIMYGCDAFFTFTRSMDEKEKKHDVAAEMKAALECIPKAGGGAGIGASFTHGFKEKKDSYCCTYHGDFKLKHNPTTFDEAVTAYKSLSQSDAKSRPQEAILAPLIDVIKACELKHPEFIPNLHQINVDLISRIQRLLEEVHEDEIKLHDLSKEKTCEQFKCLRQSTEDIARRSAEATSYFKEHISKLIPDIRCKKAEEADLENALQDRTKIYSGGHAKDVERKIKDISRWLEKIDTVHEIKIVREVELGSLGPDRVICFAFNDAISFTKEKDARQRCTLNLES